MTDPRTLSGWRLMLVPPRAAAENMARDTALMERARQTGEAVFSVYGWERPTLSLGRNEVACGRYDPGLVRDKGMDVVRRPTGGRTLIHHREVTYSVTLPLDSRAGMRQWYRRINRLLLHGLRTAGIEATEAGMAKVAAPLDNSPCFAAPARGELLANGRKLVGSAQWRDNGALLQHGSILIEDDQHLLHSVSPGRAATPLPPPATLASLLGRAPAAAEIAAALFDAVRTLEDSAAREIDESEVRPAAMNRMAEFENERWTWRR